MEGVKNQFIASCEVSFVLFRHTFVHTTSMDYELASNFISKISYTWILCLLFQLYSFYILSHNQKQMQVYHFLDTAFSTDCVILQHPVIGSESSQILMINDSFSSQTWAIFVPNRNYDQKSL